MYLRNSLGVTILLAIAGCASHDKGPSLAELKYGAPRHTELVSCGRPLATAAVVEPQQGPTAQALNQTGVQNPAFLVRLLIARSNCFELVDRGLAMSNIQQEANLIKAGLIAEHTPPKLKPVDYLVTASVAVNPSNVAPAAPLGTGFLPTDAVAQASTAIAGTLFGSSNVLKAQAVLTLTDANSSVQTVVAAGAASSADLSHTGLGTVGAALSDVSAFSKYAPTDLGILVAGALVDAYDTMVEEARRQHPTETASSN